MTDRLASKPFGESRQLSGDEAMNKPLPVNPPELRSTFVAASSMPWQRTDFDGIEMKILYKDDEGRSTRPSCSKDRWKIPKEALERVTSCGGLAATSMSRMLPTERRSSPYSTAR